ncbi:NAD(P)-dependent oxidoreductase [Agrobacterium rhizogenes]|uniref:NAD-dependent epimerase/dehydratase family protein n=1 Tax=Rhizobium rhizogenes TaxID=359 RepID=UPI001573B003|nr:NAD(P)-dependent oxidoreductase [Rhizobium rhizogenes]NTG86023.1 NAD(P)-dependent oxidoreductase [Rhizobium rhizogenes]NTH18278.1 NAD(P)-dependent oxidoreductase [Rhizobium rhizogenes]NTH31250.1 NAD(P)-dependent oxidoreductase [Rhizobium rhizogenes]NTI15429.1 NAD(P)-dependent oxidoreductase [Rhizobium rhizogenes]
MKKRILFTGGSGKAGRHTVPWLVEAGYEVHNIDLVPLNSPGVTNLQADVTDAGQVYNVLTMHRDFPDLNQGKGVQRYDAVVHFAAVPRILLKPDNETFRINTMSTYNVIEAAAKLGVKKIIVASSETTYGVCFAEGHRDFHQFPLEEDYDVNPMDSYGLSKVLNEKTARAFAERFGIDIYALRIGNVIEPHEYERFPEFFADSEIRKRIAWSYIDARDLGQIVHLCIEKSGLGFQVFNAANDTVSANTPSRELAAKHFPNVPFTREIGEYEGLLSNRKIREVLGFKEEHDWRRYVKV